MGSKLYVGGLPYAATESQLTTLFAAHGTVESARVITDKLRDSREASASSKWPRRMKVRRRLLP